MTPVKAILAFVLGAAFASIWWACAALDLPCLFWLLTSLATFLLIGACLAWLHDHWND